MRQIDNRMKNKNIKAKDLCEDVDTTNLRSLVAVMWESEIQSDVGPANATHASSCVTQPSEVPTFPLC
jgi:hypothetical protein